MYIARGADVCPKSMEFHAGLQSAGCFRACFSHIASMQTIYITWYLHLMAFLRLPKTVPK